MWSPSSISLLYVLTFFFVMRSCSHSLSDFRKCLWLLLSVFGSSSSSIVSPARSAISSNSSSPLVWKWRFHVWCRFCSLCRSSFVCSASFCSDSVHVFHVSSFKSISAFPKLAFRVPSGYELLFTRFHLPRHKIMDSFFLLDCQRKISRWFLLTNTA